MDCEIIRSRRRTMSVEITPSGLRVRAPLRASNAEIHRFLAEHSAWIEKNLRKMAGEREALQKIEPLTKEELLVLAVRAREVIPARVSYYAPLVGVSYGRITIRSQHTKWGSCSSLGNLNFNCLLMLAPPEVLDSVVVHELCHRKEMNHSQRFYAEVLRVFPDYRIWNRWLKENGRLLMARLPEK